MVAVVVQPDPARKACREVQPLDLPVQGGSEVRVEVGPAQVGPTVVGGEMKRLSVLIDESTQFGIRYIRGRRRWSVTEVIRVAIELLWMVRKGETIVVMRPDGTAKEIWVKE
jgi:hypothetical protein